MSSAEVRVRRGRVVTPAAVVDDGVVAWRDARISWVGPAHEVPAELRAAVTAAVPSEDYLLPGLVDLHCHGGGGASFPDAADAASAQAAVTEHRRHGTTSVVASLVAAPAPVLRARTEMLAGLAEAGEIAGIHLEGPFISAEHCGAQDPAAIQRPDAALTAELLAIGRGHVVTMTLAPEAPGATGTGGVSQTLVRGGALPSFGHTGASADQAGAAVREAAGWLAQETAARSARPTVTHLCNGMSPMHHRAPGPVPEFLAAARGGRVVLELVADGTHLDPALVRSVFEIAGPQNVVLVTDAMAAAGMPDGDYRLGSLAVTVAAGVARLSGRDTIAGGTAHLIDVVRSTVAGGVALVDAVYAAATGPAVVLGDTSVGALQRGRRADVVRTDTELRPVEVVRNGVRV